MLLFQYKKLMPNILKFDNRILKPNLFFSADYPDSVEAYGIKTKIKKRKRKKLNLYYLKINQAIRKNEQELQESIRLNSIKNNQRNIVNKICW